MIDRKFLLRITEKWPVKVLSVAAALILMVFYRMNTLETRFFSLPLHVQSSGRLIPVNSFVHSVRVSVRGEANNINNILEDDIEVFIDLDRYTNEGTYRVPVQIRKRGRAIGLEPLEINVDPVEIPIRLEQKISRQIPVVPVLQGRVADGYELTSQYISPTNVNAEGPRSSMEAIQEFFTGTIDLEGRFDDFSIIINIINDDPTIVIHGNRTLEYRGVISRIIRETQRSEPAAELAENDNVNDEAAENIEEDIEE